MSERFETFLTIRRENAPAVRITSCMDCGGNLDGGPMLPGDERTCRNPDCRTRWRYERLS